MDSNRASFQHVTNQQSAISNQQSTINNQQSHLIDDCRVMIGDF
jgi:hypothetical protein